METAPLYFLKEEKCGGALEFLLMIKSTRCILLGEAHSEKQILTQYIVQPLQQDFSVPCRENVQAQKRLTGSFSTKKFGQHWG